MLRNTLAGLLILSFLLAISPSAIGQGLSISPAYVDLILDKGRPAGQFNIANLGEKEERYRIKAVHYEVSKTGGINMIPPDGRSLAPWIKFNPTEFTLPGKSKRAVRFVVAPQGNLRTGEYWAAMELESLKTQSASTKDKEGREFLFEVVSTILVPIYGKYGNPRYSGALKEAGVVRKDDGQILNVLVENGGEGRFLIQGKFEIRNGSGEEVQKGTIAKAYVLPGHELILATPLASKLPEGNYKARVECQAPQLKEPMAKEFDLVVKLASP